MSEFDFDRYTKVQLVKGDISKDSEFEFKAYITSTFNIGEAPNGGYLTGICISAFQASLPHKHPRATTTCNTEKEAQVFVSKISSTKRQSIAMARIIQNGEERVRVLANFTTFDKSNTKTTIRRKFPGSPIEKCVKQDMSAHQVLKNFARMDMMMEEGSAKVWNNETDDSGVVASYLRFSDGREVDMKGLAYFADALYPTPFSIQMFSRVE